MMDDSNSDKHLSQINTMMTVLGQAKGADTVAEEARRRLVVLYYGSAYRYLLGCLRMEEVAQDLAQNFALRLMQGEVIKHAKPGQGKRFRDYLKRSLHNLVMDYYRGHKGVAPLPEDSILMGNPEEETRESDLQFYSSMREELISATWKALDRVEKETNTPYATVLRKKTLQPELRSAQLAQVMTQELGKTFSEAGIRQLIHRGRERFAELLLQNVEQALQTYDPETLIETLVDLELLEYCRPILDKRGQKQ